MRIPRLTITLLTLLTTTPLTLAQLVHITSYAGTLTTLNLTIDSDTSSATSSPLTPQIRLQTLTSTTSCGNNPGWLTQHNNILFCLNEAFGSPSGSVSSYLITPTGSLTPLSNISVPAGPVSAVLFANSTALALSSYEGSSLTTLSITNPSNLSLIQTSRFTLPRAGFNPQRQEKSHPHQAILDPSGRFLVVPDLGADLVRVFELDGSRGGLGFREVSGLGVRRGAGPRHGVFVEGRGEGAGRRWFYVVGELDSSLMGYEVSYPRNGTTTGIAFREMFRIGTHGDDSARPNGTTAAEIVVSPPGVGNETFLLLSSRFERALLTPSYNVTGATIPSDPIITFALDLNTGMVSHRQTRAAGGVNPRHFSLNKEGTLVGVGLQNEGRAVVIQRDVNSGLMGDIVADVEVGGEVNYFLWDQER